MSSKRARSNSKSQLAAIEAYGPVTDKMTGRLMNGGMMTLTAPGALEAAKRSGPPDFHSYDGETQEMAILAQLTMPEDHGAWLC